ncbi:carboxypeptidase-like regulatory domain-containing protein [Lutibacter sp. HS1-25]|uniref:carboxypeptidase-like regulatory domain-containing protein n=1 Tax=Lutibacter sp. HS1-25 TaxID=2485000 RepID=UPI001010C69D|nr:carboxypeptidase-like regulatory domain-containing protein [Lutibacter sp. HS1-25]RXP64446.1 carboxypeptidase-like regulatory domain-containing protein [Lutibacter sp. HS1-25]
MKRILVILVLLVGLTTYSQTFKVGSLIAEQTKNGTISGTIIDTEANNEPLAFVTIEIKDTNISTTSNIDGSYSFNLKPGIYTLVYSFIGYETIEVKNIEVQPNSIATNTQFLNALTPEMPVLISQLK